MRKTIQVESALNEKIQSLKERHGLENESQVIDYLYNIYLNASIKGTITIDTHSRILEKVKG